MGQFENSFKVQLNHVNKSDLESKSTKSDSESTKSDSESYSSKSYSFKIKENKLLKQLKKFPISILYHVIIPIIIC